MPPNFGKQVFWGKIKSRPAANFITNLLRSWGILLQDAAPKILGETWPSTAVDGGIWVSRSSSKSTGWSSSPRAPVLRKGWFWAFSASPLCSRGANPITVLILYSEALCLSWKRLIEQIQHLLRANYTSSAVVLTRNKSVSAALEKPITLYSEHFIKLGLHEANYHFFPSWA